MANTFEQKIKVLSSRTDDKCRLGVLGTFHLLQDNMCEYFDSIQCDGLHLVPSHNCFFVVTKTRVHFDKYFKWLDNIKLRTLDKSVSKVAVELQTTFEKDNTIYIDCMQEMCVMDVGTRKLRLVDTTPFPCGGDMHRGKSFMKLPALEDEKLVGKTTINNTGIDFYHHTNNVEYVRIILDNIPSELMDKQSIVDFEIHYLLETKLGDTLHVYREIKDSDIYFELRVDGRVATRAKVALGNVQ